MKIKITQQEKRQLLKAISAGEIDTAMISRVVSEIKGADIFELNGIRGIDGQLFKVLTPEEIKNFNKWFDENY